MSDASDEALITDVRAVLRTDLASHGAVVGRAWAVKTLGDLCDRLEAARRRIAELELARASEAEIEDARWAREQLGKVVAELDRQRARADAAARKLVDVLRRVRATEAPERKIFHNDPIAEKLFQDALVDYARRHGIVDPRVVPAAEARGAETPEILMRCRWCRRPIEHAKQLCSTVQTQTGHSTQRDCEP